MVSKKITITTDILRLITNLNIETFEMGDMLTTNRVVDTIRMIESSSEMMSNFGELRDELIKVKEQLSYISDRKEKYAWGIDQWSLWGGTYVMEQIALIIGCYDKALPDTENYATGKEFPKNLEDYMWELYHYIVDNMEYLLSLVFYYSDKGGLTTGEYKYKDGVWTKVGKCLKDIQGKDIV